MTTQKLKKKSKKYNVSRNKFDTAKMARLRKRQCIKKIKQPSGKFKTGKVRLILPFNEAREIARAQYCSTAREYMAWVKHERPVGMPQNAMDYYTKRNEPWTSWNDFLGNPLDKKLDRVSPKKIRNFYEARDYARSLMLKSCIEWAKLYRQNKLPPDLPSSPHVAYRKPSNGAHWLGWKDFLGTSYVKKYEAIKQKIQVIVIAQLPQYPSNVYAFIAYDDFPVDIYRKIRENNHKIIKAYQCNQTFDWGSLLYNNFTNYYNIPGLYLIPNINQILYLFDTNMDNFDING